MFHLLTDQAGAMSPDFEIPFVATQYDQGTLAGFGARQGYEDFDSLLKLHRDRPDSFEILLQTWFFFGLLYDLIGDDLNMDDFILRDGSPRILISSAALRKYCGNWFLSVFNLDEKEQSEIVKRVSQSIAFVTRKANEIDEYLHQDSSAAPVIMFSVKILIESIITLMKRLTLRLPDEVSSVSPYELDMLELLLIRPKPSLFLLESMLQNCWCPYRLAGISASISSIALYHLRGFDCAALIGEHHETCTESACHIDNLSDYNPQHDSECSGENCELLSAPVEKLVEIYLGDDIPVLSCVVEPSGSVKLDIIPSSKSSGYVAISHVWSDGLGNEHQNAVHSCQLKRLTTEVRALRVKGDQTLSIHDQDPTAFWLDTMCIPVNKEHEQVRRIAIGRIDWTYAVADFVLVQDKALHGLTPDSLPAIQFAAHLHCSKWLSRC